MNLQDIFNSALNELEMEESNGTRYCDQCCDHVPLNNQGEMLCPHNSTDSAYYDFTDDGDPEELNFHVGDEYGH